MALKKTKDTCQKQDKNIITEEEKDFTATSKANATTQRKSDSIMYFVWRNMMRRCYNKNDRAYNNYGGRGIIVSDEWHTFESFYQDMGDKPKGMTLDRIDNDGNYEFGNCRWTDRTTQNRNRRNVSRYKGKTIAEWSEKTGIKAKTIRARLNDYGWSWERAVQ